MEKLKTPSAEFDIISVSYKENKIFIECPEGTDLANADLSHVEIISSGGVICPTITVTVNKIEGNMLEASL
jgi:hypothetical protein